MNKKNILSFLNKNVEKKIVSFIPKIKIMKI